jgi:hypothetical protein
MNRTRKELSRDLSAALLCVVLLATMGNACSSSPNVVAVKTIGTLVNAVDLARSSWDLYVNTEMAKPLTPAQTATLNASIAKVQAAYQDYVAAIEVLKKAQPGFSNGDPVPAQLGTAASALLDLITTLKVVN